MAQEATAPRYMNWSGRGPAVMPQGVQTASNETAAPRPAAPAAAPTYADQGAPSDAADPMAPRRDAPIFRLQRQTSTATVPIPGPSTSVEDAPAAPRAEVTPAPRQMATVTSNPSDHPEMQASRRYSVHRQNGQQPDAVAIPQPTYVDALAVTLTDMPASTDLAEPAPGPNLYRDSQGRVRAAPAASDGDHQ